MDRHAGVEPQTETEGEVRQRQEERETHRGRETQTEIEGHRQRSEGEQERRGQREKGTGTGEKRDRDQPGLPILWPQPMSCPAQSYLGAHRSRTELGEGLTWEVSSLAGERNRDKVGRETEMGPERQRKREPERKRDRDARWGVGEGRKEGERMNVRETETRPRRDGETQRHFCLIAVICGHRPSLVPALRSTPTHSLGDLIRPRGCKRHLSPNESPLFLGSPDLGLPLRAPSAVYRTLARPTPSRTCASPQDP